jgi:hypothetical protein
MRTPRSSTVYGGSQAGAEPRADAGGVAGGVAGAFAGAAGGVVPDAVDGLARRAVVATGFATGFATGRGAADAKTAARGPGSRIGPEGVATRAALAATGGDGDGALRGASAATSTFDADAGVVARPHMNPEIARTPPRAKTRPRARSSAPR